MKANIEETVIAAEVASPRADGVSGADRALLENAMVARFNRRRRADRLSVFLLPLITVIIFLLAWQILPGVFSVPGYLIPPPLDVLEAGQEHYSEIMSAILVTAREAVFGFALAVVIGIPLGFFISMSKIVARSVYPIIIAWHSLPTIAVAPLFVVWFGFGEAPKIIIAGLIAFFPIVINTIGGLGSIDAAKLNLAKSMGLSWSATFFKIRLPNALPAIFGGLKLASTLSVIGAIVGEFVGSDAGIGKLLLEANSNLQTPLLFAALVFLTAFSLALFGAVQSLEKLAIPWHSSQRKSGDMDR